MRDPVRWHGGRGRCLCTHVDKSGGFRTAFSAAVFEPPAGIACLDDIAMMGEAIEHGGCHFGVAEHLRPIGECQIGGDQQRRVLIELADEVKRRQYPDEFKREALELLVSSGRPLSQIAGNWGFPPERLRAWRNRSGGSKAGSPRRPNTQAAIPPAGVDLATENARLRRENERLRMEREI